MSRPRTSEALRQEVLGYISHQASAPNLRLERLTIPAIADIVLENNLHRVRRAVDDLIPPVEKSGVTDLEARLDNIHPCPKSKFQKIVMF